MIFFDKHNILAPIQHGFRPKYSTKTALLKVINEIHSIKSKNHIPTLICIDLTKAFDRVNHHILLYKLACYGIRGLSLDWLTSFLSHRTFYTQINGIKSTSLPLLNGVPQGSILSPLLYSIYVNDFYNFINFNSVMYADDTSIILDDTSFSNIQQNIDNLYFKLTYYYQVNNLLLNESKTEILICSNSLHCPASLKFGKESIKPKKCIKYLGIHINYKLNFKEHINDLIKKIMKSFYLLYNIRHFIPKDCKKNYILLFLCIPHYLFHSFYWLFQHNGS